MLELSMQGEVQGGFNTQGIYEAINKARAVRGLAVGAEPVEAVEVVAPEVDAEHVLVRARADRVGRAARVVQVAAARHGEGAGLRDVRFHGPH